LAEVTFFLQQLPARTAQREAEQQRILKEKEQREQERRFPIANRLDRK
jgi:hypothetical protein